MNNQTSLFLSQSYKDAWDDYNRSLTNAAFTCWDYVVLTASNEQQANGFRAQLEERLQAGFLPERTKFIVVPDDGGIRVGSGGATLGVIKRIIEERGTSDFSGLRILTVHSGGDSKRVPQYSAMGKLFSPVLHELPNGRGSTVFDELMIAMAAVPTRIHEGMMFISGDVVLLFNPLQIDCPSSGAAAISFKEPVETGKDHGVYLCGDDGNVKRFLHKQTVETLRGAGAVNDRDCVDIDTGITVFSPEMISSLWSLISTDDNLDMKKYGRLVNDRTRLSLYGDFQYPLAADSTLEDFYNEQPEGEFCEELKEARTLIWNALRKFKMKLIRLAPAKFIHFGTTGEIIALASQGIENYSALEWSRSVCSSLAGSAAGYCSIVSNKATVGKNCYFEASYVHSGAEIGDNTLLSYIDIHKYKIPSNVVLHGIKLSSGKFVARIYGITDNAKNDISSCPFLGGTLGEFAKRNGIGEDELFENGSRVLWNAKLYPVCDNIDEAVEAALNIYALVNGGGDVEKWRSSERKSLCAAFNEADHGALIAWGKRMEELVRMDRLEKKILSSVPVSESIDELKGKTLTPVQKKWLDDHLGKADPSEAMRLHYYIGKALGGAEGDHHISQCFRVISDMVLEDSVKNLEFNDKCTSVTDKCTVRLPLRVNWGGGWSDTPPYCNENGGTVLNAAVILNGEMPVEVTIEKIKENKIVFDSRDMDVHGEFDSITELQATGDPFDSFALQKAALLACGIIPREGGDLGEICSRLGGGFIMRSEVTGIPKGSGLGTSSILSAACVKALLDYTGIRYGESDLYERVLCMEQIMSTGGGWQDQVGGLTNGIKYITSRPGQHQNVNVSHVQISDETKKELSERFILIHTGQRRLARNILRTVVGNYIGNERDVLAALNEIQRTAALMRFELERGNVDGFAQLLNDHWELIKIIDANCTNTLIEQIFASIEEFTQGKFISGAGGGGFLQIILKKGVKKEDVEAKLRSVFEDNGVCVWDFSLVY